MDLGRGGRIDHDRGVDSAGLVVQRRVVVELAQRQVDPHGGDPHAVRALERYADRLARALAAVVNLLDPDSIVLGGGMSNLPGLPSAVSARLARCVFSDSVLTKVVPNVHGDSSGVRGAAWLWPSDVRA